MEKLLLLGLISYFLGSIPSGFLLSQTYGKKDLTKKGSGNIGTTNAYRIAGKKIGVATFVADITKGLLAVLMAKNFFQFEQSTAVAIAGAMVVIGHIFPVWLNFKGGKGVATGLTVLTAANPTLGAISIVSFLIMFLLFRIVSMASLTAAVSVTVIGCFLVNYQISIMVIIISGLIIYRHKENIIRLLDGKESKLERLK